MENIKDIERLTFRAPTAGVVNVPNAKYLAHLPHQAQK